MKNRPITLTLALVIACALSFAALTGCEHIGGITGGVTNNNGDLGGTIAIVFKRLDGTPGQILVQPAGRRTRGLDAAGNYVSLGELRSTAIAAFKSGRSGSESARLKGCNPFDCDTVAIIVGSLKANNADPNSL